MTPVTSFLAEPPPRVPVSSYFAATGLAASTAGGAFLAGMLVWAAWIYTNGLSHAQFELIARCSLVAAMLLGAGQVARHVAGSPSGWMAAAGAGLGLTLGATAAWATLFNQGIADCLFVLGILGFGLLNSQVAKLTRERANA